MGCAVGYNLATGCVVLLVLCSGAAAVVLSVVPVEGLDSFIIFVGLIVCADAVKVLPSRHWPAYMIGLVPGVCNWAATQATTFAASIWPAGERKPNFNDPAIWSKDASGAMAGLQALGSGYILSSVCLCSVVMALVDREFLSAAGWCFVSGLLAVVGLIHSPAMFLPWQRGLGSTPWQFFFAYGCCGLLLLLLALLQAKGRLPRGPAEADADSVSEEANDGLGLVSVIERRYEDKAAHSVSSSTIFRRSFP